MFANNHIQILSNALGQAEKWSEISSVNMANVNTLGYKALVTKFAPNCAEDCNFENILYNTKSLELDIVKDDAQGKSININGKEMEGSNVNPTRELQNLVNAANMTRSILTSIQIENRIQQDIINLQTR